MHDRIHAVSESSRARRTPNLLDADGLFHFAVKALAGRALSIGELRERLRRRAADAGDIDPVIARLKSYKYLDDAQFAESFASVRRDSEGLGKARVLRDLRQRRVAPSVAEKAVNTAYAGFDEAAAVEHYLQRKYRGKNLGEYLAEEKNLAAAYRRLRYAGFSSGVSIRVLKRFASRADELADVDQPEGGEEV